MIKNNTHRTKSEVEIGRNSIPGNFLPAHLKDNNREAIMKKTMVVLFSVLLGIIWAGSIQAMEFDELGGVDIHGFISQGYLKSDANNFMAESSKGTTQFNEAGINFSTDVTEKLRIGLQFLARDLGSIGNNEVLLDWAIADYRWRDYLGLRIGNIKFQHGLYNETRDIDMLRTFVFLPQSVYNESWRESTASIQGAGLYGDFGIGVLGSMNYGAQYGTLSMPADKGPARLLEDQWTLRFVPDPAPTAVGGTKNVLTGESGRIIHGVDYDVTSIDVKDAYTGLLHWQTPIDGLLLGASLWGYKFSSDGTTTYSADMIDALLAAGTYEQAFQTIMQQMGITDPNSLTPAQIAQINTMIEQGYNAGTIEVPNLNPFNSTQQTYNTQYEVEANSWVGSLEYTWRNLVIAGEYMRTRYKIKAINQGLFKTLGVSDGTSVTREPFESDGWYGSATYRFTYWFEMGAYYSEYYTNTDDRDGENRVASGLDFDDYRAFLKDTCLTMRFDINENWVLKLEGHVMRGAAAPLLGFDNPPPTYDFPNDGSERYKKNWLLGAAKLTYSF